MQSSHHGFRLTQEAVLFENPTVAPCPIDAACLDAGPADCDTLLTLEYAVHESREVRESLELMEIFGEAAIELALSPEAVSPGPCTSGSTQWMQCDGRTASCDAMLPRGSQDEVTARSRR